MFHCLFILIRFCVGAKRPKPWFGFGMIRESALIAITLLRSFPYFFFFSYHLQTFWSTLSFNLLLCSPNSLKTWNWPEEINQTNLIFCFALQTNHAFYNFLFFFFLRMKKKFFFSEQTNFSKSFTSQVYAIPNNFVKL